MDPPYGIQEHLPITLSEDLVGALAVGKLSSGGRPLRGHVAQKNVTADVDRRLVRSGSNFGPPM